MPEIKRQIPPRKPVTPANTGSILDEAIDVSQLREERVKVCIYGRNRSGKTTLAAEFPKPILVVSSEPDENGGATSISNHKDIKILRVAPHPLTKPDGTKERVFGSAKAVTIANELAVRNPFATVVLDTVTSLQDVILVELMNLPKVPEMLDWGFVPDEIYKQRANKVRETIRPYLILKGCNVVILAQEVDHNSSEDRSRIKSKLLNTMQQGSFMAPALGATTAKWLQDNCGYVIQIYEDEVTEEISVPQMNSDGSAASPSVQRVGTGKRQRHLRLLYHPNFAAGGRWNFDPNIPEFVTADTPRKLYRQMAKFIPALDR